MLVMASKKSRYLFFWLPYDVKYSYETFLTAFYLSVKRFPCDDAIHIGHEQIFQDVPSHLPDNWLAGFNTSLPENEELKKLHKIIWTSDVFSNLQHKLKSKNLVWEHILTQEYEPLMNLFEAELIRIKKEFNIKAVVLWANCPSVKEIANRYQIPVIHNELGPLREPVYLPTCYFDFSGVNGNTEAARRFENYEAKNDKYTDFGRVALLSLFIKDQKPVRNFDEYEIGVPLQVEDDSNIIAYSNGFNNLEVINYAKSQAEKVSVRKHPYGRIDYKDIDSGSEDLTPQEFIASCKKIITINSSVGFEALLWGKPGEILGDSPFSFINYQSEGFVYALRFALLHYLVPFDFLFKIDYYDWRITQPDEDSIAEKHLYYYLNLKHGWNKTNILAAKIPVELENIFFRNLSLQFVESENLLCTEIKELKNNLLQVNTRKSQEINLLKDNLIKLQNDLNKVIKNNKNFADELSRYQHVIENIYSSKSWRLTKPLRFINSLNASEKILIPFKRRIISLAMPSARKLLANYQFRRILIVVAKKTGLYGKLKAIYLNNSNVVASSLIINVSDENHMSRDTVTNIKKIKMLKNQKGSD